MNKELNLKCAQCGKKIVISNEIKELWPFCSKRCKMIDLGKWLGEKYVLHEEIEVQEIKRDKIQDNDNE